ncbi:MAG: hypothetical protein RL490_2319, partial [Pseudomonadota bacterium]
TPDGYQVGALCIIGDQVRSFSTTDREILKRFSEVVVSQMELRQLASRDSLTGALTRRAFDQAMFDALEAHRKHGTGATLAIVDVDYFKRINDSHGHGCGDDVLVAVTAALQQALGPGAIVGRLGGEEFGVLIDTADPAHARETAEAMRTAVAAARADGRDVAVTCSIGAAPLTARITTAEAWLHAADMALYAAKAGGRDQVVMA